MPVLKTRLALPLTWIARNRLAAASLSLMTSLVVSGTYLLPSSTSQAPVRIPSYVAWTNQTIAAASHGNAVRGLVIARRCERCHGQEGFSLEPSTANLAGFDKLAMWKQLNDFRSGKRVFPVMQSVAENLAIQDYADLAAYYSMLPAYADPLDSRAFPQPAPASDSIASALHLIRSGDGQRGIPPCQVCHGPIALKAGAPSLAAQNSGYLLEQLEKFADGTRSNDINMPMRSIAAQMTEQEKQALAAYYGAGLANSPAGSAGK